VGNRAWRKEKRGREEEDESGRNGDKGVGMGKISWAQKWKDIYVHLK